MSQTCNSCVLKTQDGFHCDLTNWEIKPLEDSCFRHTRSFTSCELCNMPITGKKYLEFINDEYHVLCASCSSKMYTCQLCGEGQQCLFLTDPSPIPKTIMKTIQQGNMVMQTQVRNPEREKITCTKCICWIESECQKENGRCKNFKHTL